MSETRVELLRHTPNPLATVCHHARNDYLDAKLPDLSYEEIMEDVDGDRLEEKEQALVKKLMLRGHWGPLEHVYLSFWTRASRSAMGQITRHRHATFDIQSMRYVDMSEKDPNVFDDFRFPPAATEEKLAVREGTIDFEEPPGERIGLMEQMYADALDNYRELRERGFPAEHARMVLPIGTKVNITMSLNLRSFLHVLQMRGPDAGDAQAEIGQIAEGMKEHVERVCPVVMDVWNSNKQAINRGRLSP